MQTPQHLLLNGPEATRAFAERLASTILPNTVIALYGDLGAGKTTLTQGIIRGLGGDEAMVHSPTFTYLHLYPTSPPLYHFDLYRLSSPDDFFSMGFEETFENNSIVLIEWPERIAHLLSFPHLEIRLSHISLQTRSLAMQWT